MRFVLLSALLWSATVFAQTPGNCERGVAENDLDVGDVFARVFNTGALFFGNETTAGNGYMVPRASGNSPLFAIGVLVGGKVDDEIRVAGARYTRFEYWPGPLNEGATLPDPDDCSPYDRIFVVGRSDVANYLQTGQLTNDLRDWPVDWGAPVLDGDGVEGNYNLAGGDEPAIYGDQMAWWVMNDVGNMHEETGSDPLGIEVRASAIAVGNGMQTLRQATFYRYEIINRSENVIDSLYVTLFVDADLGDALDDWVASDTTLSIGYVLNGQDVDAIYGTPPAQGYQIIQGPVGLPNGRDDDQDGEIDEPDERLRMTAASCYGKNGGPVEMTEPRNALEYYNCMQGKWKFGTPQTASGHGYQTSGEVTVFVFPGDPVEDECWSMRNDCDGSSVAGNDLRIYVSTGPSNLAPGEVEELVFSIPFAQGSDRFDSVTQLRVAAQAAQSAWETGLLGPSPVQTEHPVPDFELAVERPFPNPFTDGTTLRYELHEATHTRISAFDVLGRRVAVLVDAEQEAGRHEVSLSGTGLSPGMYVIKFEAAGESRSFSVVKLR